MREYTAQDYQVQANHANFDYTVFWFEYCIWTKWMEFYELFGRSTKTGCPLQSSESKDMQVKKLGWKAVFQYIFTQLHSQRTSCQECVAQCPINNYLDVSHWSFHSELHV